MYVCEYVCVVYVHPCVQLYAHRYQRRMSGVLLYHSLTYSLRLGLSLKLGLGWQQAQSLSHIAQGLQMHMAVPGFLHR